MKKKFHKAYIIGRFQPFHKGHLFLIEEALKVADRAIIGIGSANVQDFDNPFSAAERFVMLQNALDKAGLSENIEKIVFIDDVPDDNDWLKLALKDVENIDLIVSNNDWVTTIFKNAGYAILQVPFYKRYIYEGKKIRAKLRSQGELLN